MSGCCLRRSVRNQQEINAVFLGKEGSGQVDSRLVSVDHEQDLPLRFAAHERDKPLQPISEKFLGHPAGLLNCGQGSGWGVLQEPTEKVLPLKDEEREHLLRSYSPSR